MNRISMKHVRAIRGTLEEVPFVDVVSKKEYIKGHIPGSVNIPLIGKEEDFVQRVEKVIPSKNQKIVLYCANGKCDASTTAARLLEERGFSFVLIFSGGLEEWIEAGGAVEQGKKSKVLIH